MKDTSLTFYCLHEFDGPGGHYTSPKEAWEDLRKKTIAKYAVLQEARMIPVSVSPGKKLPLFYEKFALSEGDGNAHIRTLIPIYVGDTDLEYLG